MWRNQNTDLGKPSALGQNAKSSKFGSIAPIPRGTLLRKTRTVRINFPLYTVHERVIFVVFLRFAAHFVRSSAAKKIIQCG